LTWQSSETVHAQHVILGIGVPVDRSNDGAGCSQREQPLPEIEPDGWIAKELAECYLAVGKDAEAKPLFSRAYDALKNDPWVLKNEPAKLERLERLAGK
jgi:hypothetical protein